MDPFTPHSAGLITISPTKPRYFVQATSTYSDA